LLDDVSNLSPFEIVTHRNVIDDRLEGAHVARDQRGRERRASRAAGC
jgi:hypothetical protein